MATPVLIHGANNSEEGSLLSQLLTGKTVREALAIFSEPYNIPADATFTVNGDPESLDYELQDGDELIFAKAAGSKG